MLDIDTLLVLIPALPLAACLLVACCGRVLKEQSHWPVVLAFAGSCALSLILLFQVKVQSSESLNGGQGHIGYEHVVTLWTWADVQDAYTPHAGGGQAAGILRQAASTQAAISNAGTRNQTRRHRPPRHLPHFPFDIDVTLRADPLTCIHAGDGHVHLHAGGDLCQRLHARRPGYWRFFAYIALFVFSMTMLRLGQQLCCCCTCFGKRSVCAATCWSASGMRSPPRPPRAKKRFWSIAWATSALRVGLFLIWTTYGTLNFHDINGVAGSAGQQMAGVFGQSRRQPDAVRDGRDR